MQMCACYKEHMRKVIRYVFCALHGFPQAELLAGIIKTTTGKACSVWKTLGQLKLETGLCFNAQA